MASNLPKADLHMFLKILFCLSILVCVCSPVVAQTACRKPETETPTIRGFKLGMTIDQVKQIYTILRDNTDETGYFSEKLATLFLPDEQKRGVSSVELGFLDGRVVSILVAYDDSTKWESVAQLATAVSESLRIPSLWTEKTDSAHPEVTALQVVCGKITYAVAGGRGPSLTSPLLVVFRNDTKPIRDARRAKIEEMKRRSFKP